MRVIVCGSRSFTERAPIHADLDRLLADLPDGERLFVINGFALGADRMADEWASEADRAEPLRFRPDWANCDQSCPPHDHRRRNSRGGLYCPLAGPRRNQKMLDVGRPDLVLAYLDKQLKDSRGTADMVSRAHKAGVPVRLRPVLYCPACGINRCYDEDDDPPGSGQMIMGRDCPRCGSDATPTREATP